MMDDVTRDFLQVEATGVERRIPVYLLVDTSTSMQGAGIASVNRHLPEFASEVMENSIARDSIAVGLITFSSTAEMVTGDLVSLKDFQAPALVASGVTRLDEAFRVLRQSLNTHVRRPVVGKHKGDGRPIVFIFTDGHPTDANGNLSDNWREPRDSVVSDQLGGSAPKGTIRLYDIYPVGCGDVDENTLQEISTGLAFKASDNVAFSNFIKLATMVSIMSAEKMGGGTGGASTSEPSPILSLDDLPPELLDDVVAVP